jgi:4-hydroxy-tetrahydrodipicolinate synthase
MIEGVITALVTPFKNGKIDEKGFEKLIEFQIREGADGILIAGTTGESATLKDEEKEFLFKKAKEIANDRIKIIAGCGTNDTRKSIELVKLSEKAGIDTFLLVCPYYNKPTQEGLYRHFGEIAKNTNGKIILYNVPGRTSSNLEPKTVKRLVNDFDNIIGVKEASKNLDQMMELYELVGDKISLLSGDDSWTFPLLTLGYKGVVSVLSNIIIKPIKEMIKYVKEGKIEEAAKIHYKYLPLMKDLFIETNPVPVKTAMEILGWISSEVRLPLSPLKEENRKKIEETLKKYQFPEF